MNVFFLICKAVGRLVVSAGAGHASLLLALLVRGNSKLMADCQITADNFRLRSRPDSRKEILKKIYGYDPI